LQGKKDPSLALTMTTFSAGTALAELSQLRTFFSVLDLIFIVKPCVFIGAL
jgi:hypothetical protein